MERRPLRLRGGAARRRGPRKGVLLFLALAVLLQACVMPFSRGSAQRQEKPPQSGAETPGVPGPSGREPGPELPDPGQERSGLAVYVPQEYSLMDLTDPASRWCYARSLESEHFILFWDAGFGSDPAGPKVPERMRVDPHDVLERAERYYATNVERLGFGPREGEESWLDVYKMEIFLYFQDEWMATAAGYDDVIGAAWLDPQACRAEDGTLAHEMGHCFQYQVACDLALRGEAEAEECGFRYSPGDGFGSTFWEQCAQFQSVQDHPERVFPWYDREAWLTQSGRAMEHEWTLYQNFWFPLAATELHGEDAVARLWRESRAPEDALGAYLRLFCGGDMEKLGEELYFYASRAATFDFDGVRDLPQDWTGGYETVLYPVSGALRISYASAPEQGGFNVIAVDPGSAGATVSAVLRELDGSAAPAPSDPAEYRTGPEGETVTGGTAAAYAPEGFPGGSLHRFGFVALCRDGRRVYGGSTLGDGTAELAVPEDAEAVYLVVAAVGTEISPHVWDEDESTDGKMPYEIVLSGCGLAG